MDFGKLLSYIAIGVSVATALAVPLADINPKYGLLAGVVAVAFGAIGKGITDNTGKSGFLTALGVAAALSAAVVSFAGVDQIVSVGALAVIAHAGAIAAALGKGLMGAGDSSPIA
jgi:hypothetical protein